MALVFALIFVFGCSSKKTADLDFIGKWKFEKIVMVSQGGSKMEDANKIFGKCVIEVDANDFDMCGEKTLGVTYNIVKESTKERDPRLNNYMDSYQYGFGKDRKVITFFRILEKNEVVAEFECFENRLIYYWDGFLIYYKKVS